MIRLEAESDIPRLEQDVQRLVRALDRRGREDLMQVLGKGLEQDLQKHFRARNQEPNKKGWPKQNFWARIRRATSFAGASAEEARVEVSDPAFAAKVHGARNVRPRSGTYLTIPMRPEAYGVRASSGVIPGLFFLRSRRGRAYLASTEASGDGKLRLYYRLVKSVNLPADNDALPPRRNIERNLVRRTDSFVRRQLPPGNN